MSAPDLSHNFIRSRLEGVALTIMFCLGFLGGRWSHWQDVPTLQGACAMLVLALIDAARLWWRWRAWCRWLDAAPVDEFVKEAKRVMNDRGAA